MRPASGRMSRGAGMGAGGTLRQRLTSRAASTCFVKSGFRQSGYTLDEPPALTQEVISIVVSIGRKRYTLL